MRAYAERPYRAGVGMMLLNGDGLVFVGKRIDQVAEAWQMPQGGIDEGEEARAAAKRELVEEVGTDKFEIVAESSTWLHYDLPEAVADKVWKARGYVQILVGWNSSKYYHGDLMERAMCLLLALTGSVGNKGSGIRGWNESLFEGSSLLDAISVEDLQDANQVIVRVLRYSTRVFNSSSNLNHFLNLPITLPTS